MPPDPSADDTLQAPTTETTGSTAVARDIDIDALPTGNARYALGELLGKGGMGDVLLAEDKQIHREVAIKRMRSRHAGSVDRFLREARIQGRLDHPAIVPIHEVAVDDAGRPYFVMKRLAGTTLADILADRGHVKLTTTSADKHPLARLLRAFTDVCLAVDFAHSRGVIHRDLKPANIMLGDFGEVYVLDWGVARDVGDDRVDSLELEPGAAPAGATEAGAVLGTIGYMPPEQLRGLPVDRRADVYALGCVLFEILAGSSLHKPGELTAVFDPYDGRPSVRAPHREVPPELDALVARATDPDPAKRPASARELCDRVQRYLDGDRDIAMRRKLAREQVALAHAALLGELPAVRVTSASDIMRRQPTEDERRRVIQHAGRAIALDPTNAEAADLVGRVMLAPPEETPREVDAELDAVDDANLRHHSRIAFGAFLIYLAFLPVMMWVGVTDKFYLTSFATIGALNAVCAYVFAIREKPLPLVFFWFVALANMAMAGFLGRMFSPLLVAPGLAAATMLGFSFHPRFGKPYVLAAGLSGAIVGPWIAERLGWVSRTIFDLHGMIGVRSPAGAIDASRFELAHAVYVIATVLICGEITARITRAQRETRRTAHLQAWHLRQLVPLEPQRR